VIQPNPVDPHLARLDWLQVVETAEQRALAGSAGANDHHHLPASDFQIDAFEDVEMSEVLVSILDLNH
jgi:hypothetical protein